MGEVNHVDLGDVRLEYETAGAASGDTLLLVHGFTGSRDDFEEQLPHLAEHGRTIAMDQRGHGGSTNLGRPDAYTFDAMVADLAAFIDALDPQPLDLLGHSMGGMVAMRYALAHPGRLRSLILMDTSPGPIAMLAAPMREAGVAFARTAGMGGLADIIRSGMEQSGDRPPSMLACVEAMGPDVYFARIKRKLEQMDVEAFDQLGAALGDHESVVPRLGEITIPTLVIVGEEDAGLRPGSDQLAAEIPNAAFEVVADAAHSPQHENPTAWLAAITDHLSRVRGPR